MTTRPEFEPTSPEFDRLMAAWFDTEARVHEPEDLLERAISRTARKRPRPAWLLPERWIPVELAMRRVQIPRAARYLTILVILLIAAALAYAIVGSPRRVPAPFGPAANGLVTYATSGGDIATVNPSTGVARTVVGGSESDRFPVFSLDGTKIAFVRQVTGGDEVFVVDESGGGLVRITNGPLAIPGRLTWSPDGSRIAFVSGDHLWIANTNGSGANRLDLDVAAGAELAWRPPDGRELIILGSRNGKAELYLVGVDGTGLKPITSLNGGDGAFQWISPSPDGSRVAFGMYPELQVHVVTIDQGRDQLISPDGNAGLNFPRWSPDGTRIAVLQVPRAPTGPTRIGVIPAADVSPQVTLTGPEFTGGVQFDWSPDGSAILAVQWETDEPWRLDPAGGPGQRMSWTIASPDSIEWQRLAP